MSRREQREEIFKLLYRFSFYEKDDYNNQLEIYKTSHDLKLTDQELDYILNKVASIVDNLQKIDDFISNNTIKWSIDRLSKVILSILRLGVYEIIYDADIPDKVAVNEAVELAKKYADEDDFGFVNALLGKAIS